jgi:hypothetical protein
LGHISSPNISEFAYDDEYIKIPHIEYWLPESKLLFFSLVLRGPVFRGDGIAHFRLRGDRNLRP